MANGIHGSHAVTLYSPPQTHGENGVSTRHSSVSSSDSVNGLDELRQENILQLEQQLQHWFPGDGAMAALRHDRAVGLDEMGYNPDSVQAVLNKGKKLDDITSAAAGAITTIPYAISGFPGEALSKAASLLFQTPQGSLASDIIGGVMAGGSAVVLKAYSDKVLANVVKDAKWLESDKAMLDPAMQQVVEHRDGLAHSLQQAVLGGVGFDTRNLVTGGAAVATSGLKENLALAANTTLNVALTPAAGSMSGVIANRYSALSGPEFLLGRNDWKSRFQALDHTSIGGQMLHGTRKRLITAAQDMLTSPRQIAKGLMNPFSGNVIAETMMLASGLGGVNALRNRIRGYMQSVTDNQASQQAMEQLVNVGSAGVAYALQGVAGSLAGPAPTRNDQAVDYFFDQHPDLDLSQRLWGRRSSTDEEQLNATQQDAPRDDPREGMELQRMARPENPVAARLEQESIESLRDRLPRPGNPVAAQLEQQSLASLHERRPVRQSSAEGSQQTPLSQVRTRSELTTLQVQEKIAQLNGKWPLAD